MWVSSQGGKPKVNLRSASWICFFAKFFRLKCRRRCPGSAGIGGAKSAKVPCLLCSNNSKEQRETMETKLFIRCTLLEICSYFHGSILKKSLQWVRCAVKFRVGCRRLDHDSPIPCIAIWHTFLLTLPFKGTAPLHFFLFSFKSVLCIRSFIVFNFDFFPCK